MSSNLSRPRLRKAFNEGRRAAAEESAQNPYDNPKLRELWDQGRAAQRAGVITTPIPALEHGERRAARTPHNPPGSKLAARPPARRSNAPRPGQRRR